MIPHRHAIGYFPPSPRLRRASQSLPARNATPASSAKRSFAGWHSVAGGENFRRFFPIIGKNLPLFLCVFLAARAANAAGDFNTVADRAEREIRALDVKLQCVPNPAELSAASTSVTVRVEAHANEAARARINALLVELREAARALGGATVDVRLVQECRWSVNGMAWGPTAASRVTEIAPVPARTAIPFGKIGTASVVADLEWRIEPVRSDPAKGYAVPWQGARARSVAKRTVASVSTVRASVAAVPPMAEPSFSLTVTGPATALTDQAVVLSAAASGLNKAGVFSLPQAKIVWSSRGRVLGEGNRVTFTSAEAGACDVVAMLVKEDRGSRVVWQTARHRIDVRDKSEALAELAKQQAAEEARRAAALRAQQAQLEQEKRQAEEAQRLAEEQRKADEAAKQAEEQLAKQKADTQAAEAAAAKEQERAELAAAKERELAQAAAESEMRAKKAQLEAEIRKAEEAKQLAEEQQKAAEAKKLAEEQLAKQKAEADAAAAAAAQEMQRAELAAARERELAEAAAAAELRAKQAEVEAQEKLAARQRKLVDDGAALEKRGNLPGAIAKYESALAVAPDEVLSARIAELQRRQSEQEEQQRREDEARSYVKDGKAFERKGDLAGAILAYEEAQKLVPSDELAARVTSLNEQKASLDAERQRDEAARALVDEGHTLEKNGDLAGAVQKYEGSLALVADASIARRVTRLKKQQVAAEEEKRREAEAEKRAAVEAEAAAAVAKEKEAAAAAAAADLAAKQAEEAAQAQRKADAGKLEDEGKALESSGDLGGAVAKYEAAVQIVPSVALGKRIKDLQKQQAELDELARRDEAAQKLAGEGEALEQSGDLAGAAAKYEASIKVVPDAVLKKRISDLKKQIAGLEEQARRDEEARKQAELDRAKEEQRLAAEAQAKEESRIAAEAKAKADEEARLAAEERMRKDAEAAAVAERARVAAQLAADAKAQEEAKLAAETAAKAELQKAADEAAAEKAAEEAAAKERAMAQAAAEAELRARQAALETEKAKAEEQRKADAAAAAAAQEIAAAPVQPAPEPEPEVVAPAAAPAETAVQAAAVVPAIEYELSLAGPVLEGKKPKLWDASKHMLVDVTDRLAVFQDIGFSVAVQPEPDAKPLRYEWSIEPAGCSANTFHERAIRIRASEAGTYTLGVTVRDANDVVLGTASFALAISVSRDDLDRALAAQDADAKVARAKGLAEKGRLDEAIAAVADALKMDPSSQEAATYSEKWLSDRKVVQEQIAVSRGWIAKKDYEQASAAWSKAKALLPQYAPVRELEDDLKSLKHTVDRAQNLVNEGYAQEQRGNPTAAIAKYEAAVKLMPDAKLSTRIADLQKRQTEVEAQKLIDEGFEQEQGGNIAAAISRYEKAVKILPDARVSAHIEALKAAPAKQ